MTLIASNNKNQTAQTLNRIYSFIELLKEKKKNKACNNFHAVYQAKSTYLDNDLEF